MSEGPARPPGEGIDDLDEELEQSDPDECSVCLDFDWAERDAERMGDPSSATDWRVLRRRHEVADYPAEERIVAADRAVVAD